MEKSASAAAGPKMPHMELRPHCEETQAEAELGPERCHRVPKTGDVTMACGCHPAQAGAVPGGDAAEET